MKFTVQTIADSINFQDTDYIDLYPGYSNKDTTEDRKEYYQEYMFKSKKKFTEYANDIISLFDSFPQEFPIYRSISVKSENEIRMDDLGESWSFDLESAREFGYHNHSNIILSAIINSDNVDWYESMYRYLRFSERNDSDDENEIVVIDTNELRNVTISKIKEAKEIGKNPIFTRQPYVKSFESWLKENKLAKDEFLYKWKQSSQTKKGIPLTKMNKEDAYNWVGYNGQEKITVYRGSDSIREIQNGDFVTTSKEAAKMYGKNISQLEVPAKDLRYVRGSKNGDPKLLDVGGQTELIYNPQQSTFHKKYHSYDYDKYLKESKYLN